jgi:hypothetical protein
MGRRFPGLDSLPEEVVEIVKEMPVLDTTLQMGQWDVLAPFFEALASLEQVSAMPFASFITEIASSKEIALPCSSEIQLAEELWRTRLWICGAGAFG